MSANSAHQNSQPPPPPSHGPTANDRRLSEQFFSRIQGNTYTSVEPQTVVTAPADSLAYSSTSTSTSAQPTDVTISELNINEIDPTTQLTPLASAVQNYYPEVVELLLEVGVDVVAQSGKVVCNVARSVVSGVSTATSHKEDHPSLVSASREIQTLLESHPSMWTTHAKPCHPWLLWYHLLNSSSTDRIVQLLEAPDSVSDHPHYDAVLQRTGGESEDSVFVSLDVNAPAPVGIEEALSVTPLAGAMYTKCFRQKWSPLYFAAETCVQLYQPVLCVCRFPTFYKSVFDIVIPFVCVVLFL